MEKPEEGWRTQKLKPCDNNSKDEEMTSLILIRHRINSKLSEIIYSYENEHKLNIKIKKATLFLLL